MTDPYLTEVANLLFGDGLEISKMNPDGADLHSNRALKAKRERTQARVGLASNIVGITAGAAATGTAYKDLKRARTGKKVPHVVEEVEHAGKKLGKLTHIKAKYAVPVAGAALGLQTSNVAGDLVANRVLSRESKKKISKSDGLCLPTSKGKLVKVGVKKAEPAAQGFVGDATKKLKNKLQKNFDVVWEGEFSKVDADKRQVFGWASIVEKDGNPVVDLQGDYISIDEIEKSAYEYVVKSRKGGDMHERVDGEMPLHVSDMIESFIVTPEKIEKMGLPNDSLPLGWWVGYQINDDNTWNLVKTGKRTGFSIHGRGRREPLSAPPTT